MVEVKFRIDDIEYSFDERYMLWKSLSVEPEVVLDVEEDLTKKKRLIIIHSKTNLKLF